LVQGDELSYKQPQHRASHDIGVVLYELRKSDGHNYRSLSQVEGNLLPGSYDAFGLGDELLEDSFGDALSPML
jgi:hypothetical protein